MLPDSRKHAMMNWKAFSKDVKFKETGFGLPWIIASAALPFADPHFVMTPRGALFWVWFFLAFASARIAGMAFNRLIDRHIDAANPRTYNRSLPSGETTPKQVFWMAILSLIVFEISCALINRLCLLLSPIVILLLWGYSYTKRYTLFCHFILGMVHFFGSLYAWIAVTESLSLLPVLLGVSLLTSIASNDILYALQDREFDQSYGLHSIPAVVGEQSALWIARLLHLITIVFLIELGRAAMLPAIYYFGVGVIALIYAIHHTRLNIQNLNDVNQRFFYCNLLVGGFLMFFTLGSVACLRLL